MKKSILTIIISALALCYASAQNDSLFNAANQFYQQQNYSQAAEIYEQLLLSEPAPQLHYNLANAYFKQSEIGLAILNYERAIRLQPIYPDAKHNLKIAQSRIIDNVEQPQSFFIAQWATALRNLLSEPVWSIISISLFITTLVLIMLFLFLSSVKAKKISFYTALLTLTISIVAFTSAASLHHRDQLRAEAIVMTGIVNAKSTPDQSGTDLFTLHEGTKITIRDQVGEWIEIQVGSYRGWIKTSNVERI